MPDSFDTVDGWKCPLCKSTALTTVVVTKPGGKLYKTEFFECDGCTVMFHHKGRFTRLGRALRRWSGDIGPVSLADVHKTRLTLQPKSIWVRNRTSST